MSTILVDVDEIGTLLGFAAADLTLENARPEPAWPVNPEIVMDTTDNLLFHRLGDVDAALAAPHIVFGQAGSALSVGNSLKDVARDIWEWTRTVLRGASNKIDELANKVLDTAEQLGVSAGALLMRLYRRTVRFLVTSSILGPFDVREGTQTVAMSPTEASFSVTSKFEPSLGAGDLASIATSLTSLMKLEVAVTVKYAPPRGGSSDGS